MAGWLVGWLAGWLVGWLVGWSVAISYRPGLPQTHYAAENGLGFELL